MLFLFCFLIWRFSNRIELHVWDISTIERVQVNGKQHNEEDISRRYRVVNVDQFCTKEGWFEHSERIVRREKENELLCQDY